MVQVSYSVCHLSSTEALCAFLCYPADGQQVYHSRQPRVKRAEQIRSHLALNIDSGLSPIYLSNCLIVTAQAEVLLLSAATNSDKGIY